MKKIISLFLSIILIFSLSVHALADDNLLNYRWNDVEQIVQDSFGSTGNIWPIDEVNVTMWLPKEFIPVDPAAEGFENCLGLFTSSDGVSYVLINYIDSDGLDLNSYYNYTRDQAPNIYKILVNDIPALEQDSTDSFMVMFMTQEGKLLQFLFSPASNPVYGLVMSSIQSTVAEEAVPVVEPEPVEVPATPAPVNPVSGLISK
jgi:hypothetical protein